MASKSVLYISSGADLLLCSLAPDGTSFTKQSSVSVPGAVQYAWRHPAKNLLYVASGHRHDPKAIHSISVFSIDAASGKLDKAADDLRLHTRPIHLCVDQTGHFLLIAYGGPNCRNGIGVHAIAADGSLGPEIKQPANLDVGIFPHQVRISPSNDRVLLPARGNDAVADRSENPGAIKVFAFSDGRLENLQSVAPDGGWNFRPRHLDFHPNGRWVYLTVESQNLLQMYEMEAGRLSETPSYAVSSLQNPSEVKRPQMASAVHMHPGGTHVYISNRGYATTRVGGQSIFAGGENSIAVYAIDQETGEPSLVQSAATESFHPRTFSINNSALLVATGIMPMPVRVGGEIKHVPPRLTAFNMESSGKLKLAGIHDLDLPGEPFWSGFIDIHS